MDLLGGSIYALVFIALLLIALFYARKWLFTWLRTPDDEVGHSFTLADFRALHKAGKMSDEEFEKAKAQLVQMLHAKAAKAAPVDDPSALPRRTASPEKSDSA